MWTKKQKNRYYRRWRKKNLAKCRERDKIYKQNNKEKVLFRKRRWIAANKEKIRKTKRRWNKKNRKKINAWMRTYRKTPKMKSYIKEYLEKNRATRAAKRKIWYAKNRKSILAYTRKYQKTAIPYHKKHPERHKLCVLIKKNRGIKKRKTIALIGCSVAELRRHLESLFLPGMNWSNHSYRGWHIDHRFPCASFDLTKEKDQKKCFHYTNLQPLWAKDNMKKGDKIIYKS